MQVLKYLLIPILCGVWVQDFRLQAVAASLNLMAVLRGSESALFAQSTNNQQENSSLVSLEMMLEDVRKILELQTEQGINPGGQANLARINQDIKTVEIWVSAFIPGKIPGYTVKVPLGEHIGKSSIPGAPAPNAVSISGKKVANLFLTDQRSFSPEWRNSTHRFLSVLNINIPERTATTHTDVGATIEIDPSTGEVVCNSANGDGGTFGGLVHSSKQAELERLKFKYTLSPPFDSQSPSDSSRTVMDQAAFQGGAANRCFSISPEINANISVTVITQKSIDRMATIVHLEGEIDHFPAFEAYARVNGNIVLPLIQANPPKGNTPFDLINPPLTSLRPVTAMAIFATPNAFERPK